MTEEKQEPVIILTGSCQSNQIRLYAQTGACQNFDRIC